MHINITDINKEKQVLNQWFSVINGIFVQTMCIYKHDKHGILYTIIHEKSEILCMQVVSQFLYTQQTVTLNYVNIKGLADEARVTTCLQLGTMSIC